MTDQPATPLHIILIHGTSLFPWQLGAVRQWTAKGSPLRQAVEASMGSRATLDTFPWSGRNSFAVRARAAKELAQRILETPKDARVVLVAHSHAGNIAMLASRVEGVADRVKGIACLSTPFLHVRERIFTGTARWLAGFGYAFFMLGFPLYAAISLASAEARLASIKFGRPVVPSEVSSTKFWIMAMVTMFLLQVLDKGSKWIGPEHVLPELTTTRLFILRCRGDEASGVLGFATTLSSFIARAWGKVSRGFLAIILGIVLAPLFAIALLFTSWPFGGRPGLTSLKTEIISDPMPPGSQALWDSHIMPGVQSSDAPSDLYHSQSHSSAPCIERLVAWLDSFVASDADQSKPIGR